MVADANTLVHARGTKYGVCTNSINLYSGKPFPQEEELKTKSARLVELNAELDVGGNAPGAAVIDDGDDTPGTPAQDKAPMQQRQNER